MKKLIFITATVLSLTATSAFAGSRAFGDGSRENSYITGQHVTAPVADNVKNPARFYRGDHSIEDNYYIGRHMNSPIEHTNSIMDNLPHFGDGSPANQQS
ncbi:hypothetical protein N5853_00945 [Bartonella sp. HY329]|uniref:hypothetical protein n=1 Tax=unclassified Bartonella TaxID=2645622 RepID=UPI0021C6ACB5|nr:MULTISPECIES: hypothetical protein [unclassified Bartonella]UXM95255.1 hypothetical protein N5853_00945 [Bartonella sp. HY329]UXN09579.1 hypothetical protein N5852_00950 [Bartonella sp. HY328]